MREHLRKLTVIRDGAEVPLVRSERTLYQSTDTPPPLAPPFWLPAYLSLGIAVGAAAFGLAAGARERRFGKIGFQVVAMLWVFLSGVGGMVLAGLWALTDHAAAYQNENVLQANVLALPLLWLIPRALRLRAKGRGSAFVLAAIVAGVSITGLLLKVLPGFYQVNGSVIALALPAHLGIAAALWRSRV
jgi:hypothetical protein